jgi:hypothetical protein
MKWFRRIFWMHHWDYRNPFNKVCKVCGQHQQMFCEDYKDALKPHVGWWELISEGEESKHYE